MIKIILIAVFLTISIAQPNSCFAQGAQLVSSGLLLEPAKENALLNRDEKKRLGLLRASPAIRKATVMKINSSALTSNAISMEIPGIGNVEVKKDRAATFDAGGNVWSGKTANGGEVSLASSEGTVSAIINEKNQVFEIRSLGPRYHVLLEISTRDFPPDHPPGAASQPHGKSSEPVPPAGLQSINDLVPPNVSILFAYTPRAEQILGNISQQIALAINRMNEALLRAGANFSVSRANAISIQSEYASSDAALGYIIGMPRIIDARDNSMADLVVLIADFSNSCGQAAAILANPETGFAVVAANCMNANLSMAHEIGHLLGARHDIQNDSTNFPYAYGHGFWRASIHNTDSSLSLCYHTIMSYPVSRQYPCPSDPRINYWSSPNTDYLGNPVGTNGVANVAAVLRETGRKAATFHEVKLGALKTNIITKVLESMVLLDE